MLIVSSVKNTHRFAAVRSVKDLISPRKCPIGRIVYIELLQFHTECHEVMTEAGFVQCGFVVYVYLLWRLFRFVLVKSPK